MILKSYGQWLLKKQEALQKPERDYSFIEYYRKAYENMHIEEEKRYYYFMLLQAEAVRDYNTRIIRQIDHLVQFGVPNFDLKEPECDLYKVSISFEPITGKKIFLRKTACQLFQLLLKAMSKIWLI